MTSRLPVVNYLTLDDGGGLTGVECDTCHARFFDAGRPACAQCGSDLLTPKAFASTGRVRTFTVVHRSAPGVTVPFISAVVDLDDGGPTVRANLLGVPVDPASVPRDLRVGLELYDLDTDDAGTVAVGFGFRPYATEEGTA
jgi:uncharacterized OB-fold protein